MAPYTSEVAVLRCPARSDAAGRWRNSAVCRHVCHTARRGGLVADSIAVTFLAQGAQPAEAVAQRFVAFIDGARQSLDIAAYDVRLSPPLLELVGAALRARLASGVAVRIVYDADKPEPPDVAAGQDPAPPG